MKFKKPKFWDYEEPNIIAYLLLPFSYLINFINFFLKKKKIKTEKIKTICVGNIYLGGTGKTPLVREIFNITKSLGKNPAFIKKYHPYLSDEIKMLKNKGETFTDHKRQKSILLSISNNHDVAILDDGFQDFSVRPDFSILCFNSKQMIGNGLLIPSGPLRENF